MAEAVVAIVSRRLVEFTIQEAIFLYGVSEQVRLAQTELRLMQGFLKDADVRQRNDETVRIWVAEIRDAAYDLEDVIEICALKVARKRGGGFKYVLKRFACILNEGVELHKIGSEIQSITTKVTNLRLSMQTYNIREIRETGEGGSLQLYETQQQLRRTYSHIIGRDVVGLEDDVKELIEHLVNDENCHRVVSIWGMGGLGKTTLAQQVYHHKQVRSHFDCSAWMCVSQRCKVREVWEGILIKLISATNEQREEIAKMKDDEIARKLHLVQKEGRCLVVLDDIWSKQTLDSLKAAFPLNEESRSRIILTTRKRNVASHPDRSGILHQPRPLNDDESWELFQKIAITGRDRTHSESQTKKKELGQRMLQYCGGLPLAITVLAGLLARKDSVNEWENVLYNIHIFRWGGRGEESAGALRVLELSYEDLPYHLKPCFLYFGNFPEDSQISVKMLTQLWIAEGFISLATRREGLVETMEEVAYNWLGELVERCMVQVGEQGSIRKMKSCCLHDLVRDMCLLKAEEENFLQVVSLNSNEANHTILSAMETKAKLTGKVRRLAIYVEENVDKLVSKDEIDDNIRSLIYFAPMNLRPKSMELIRSFFKFFKLLRVLKVEFLREEVDLPTEVGSMIHLRYFSLRGSTIKRLPSSVAKLTCMQTLDFRSFITSRKCPNVVGKMKQLRHLYLPRDPLEKPLGKQKLSSLGNLQTLHISSDDFDWTDLTELTSLRKLAIEISSPLKNMEETLKSASTTLNRVQSLSVSNNGLWLAFVLGLGLGLDRYEGATQIVSSCSHIYKLIVSRSVLELPKDPQHYPNLTKLNLLGCVFMDDQMAILEKLPNLTTFTFDILTFEENRKTLVCSKGGFRRLQALVVGSSNLDEWKVEEGAMPNLCTIHIHYWTELRRVPEGLRYITTLKELKITGMRRTECSRLQEGGEDHYKIQHVPSLIFENIYESEEDVPLYFSD